MFSFFLGYFSSLKSIWMAITLNNWLRNLKLGQIFDVIHLIYAHNLHRCNTHTDVCEDANVNIQMGIKLKDKPK